MPDVRAKRRSEQRGEAPTARRHSSYYMLVALWGSTVATLAVIVIAHVLGVELKVAPMPVRWALPPGTLAVGSLVGIAIYRYLLRRISLNTRSQSTRR